MSSSVDASICPSILSADEEEQRLDPAIPAKSHLKEKSDMPSALAMPNSKITGRLRAVRITSMGFNDILRLDEDFANHQIPPLFSKGYSYLPQCQQFLTEAELSKSQRRGMQRFNPIPHHVSRFRCPEKMTFRESNRNLPTQISEIYHSLHLFLSKHPEVCGTRSVNDIIIYECHVAPNMIDRKWFIDIHWPFEKLSLSSAQITVGSQKLLYIDTGPWSPLDLMTLHILRVPRLATARQISEAVDDFLIYSEDRALDTSLRRVHGVTLEIWQDIACESSSNSDHTADHPTGAWRVLVQLFEPQKPLSASVSSSPRIPIRSRPEAIAKRLGGYIHLLDDHCRVDYLYRQKLCSLCKYITSGFHKLEDCPQFVCRTCHQQGHFISQCPTRLTDTVKQL